MFVKIGPYKQWFGPHHLCSFLKYVGVPKGAQDWIAEWLPLAPFEWLYTRRDRKIKVVVHDYDIWSMDHTLSLIILPMLRKLRAEKHGGPYVEDIDVPEHLRSTAAPTPENAWDVDEHFFARWDYILGEMIWAFEQIADEDSDDQFYQSNVYLREAHAAHEKRIRNGTVLFGKYYKALWD